MSAAGPPQGARVPSGQQSGVSRKRGGTHSHRRAAPRCELLPLGGQRSGLGRKRGGTHSHRRAAPRCELLPLGGQRSGVSRKHGGTPMIARR
jgi:hypothetical protein